MYVISACTVVMHLSREIIIPLPFVRLHTPTSASSLFWIHRYAEKTNLILFLKEEGLKSPVRRHHLYSLRSELLRTSLFYNPNSVCIFYPLVCFACPLHLCCFMPFTFMLLYRDLMSKSGVFRVVPTAPAGPLSTSLSRFLEWLSTFTLVSKTSDPRAYLSSYKEAVSLQIFF